MFSSEFKSPWFAISASCLAVTLILVAMSFDERALLLIRNTGVLATGVVALSVPLGAAIAFLLVRTDMPGRSIVLVVFAAMLFVPLYLQAAGWDAGFGKQGWYSYSHGSVVEPLLDGMRAAIWIHAMAALPWVILIVGLGLVLVEPDAEEAAMMDGSMLSVFLSVTARRAAPFIMAAMLWVFVTVGTEMTVSDLYRVRTFAEEIYIDIPYAGGIDVLQPLQPTGMTIVLLISSLVALSLMLVSRLVPPTRMPSIGRHRRFSLGKWRLPIAVVLGIFTLLIVGVPLSNMVYKAGLVVEQVDGTRVRAWLPSAFLRVVSTSPLRFGEEHGWSILISSLAATGSVALAAPAGWFARQGRWREVPSLFVAAICLAIPGPMIGLSVIWLLNREGSDVLIWLYDRSVFAPWLAMLVKALPIALLILWYAFRRVPEDLVDSAKSEGAGAVTRFIKIGVLGRRRALAVAWLASFAVAAGDLAASILVRPPGVTTVSVRVFELLHSGVDDQVAGLSLTAFGFFALVGGLTLYLARSTRTFGNE